jgi:hypothetical protein
MRNVGLDLPCEALVPMRTYCASISFLPPFFFFARYSFQLLHRFRFIAWRILPYDSFNESIVSASFHIFPHVRETTVSTVARALEFAPHALIGSHLRESRNIRKTCKIYNVVCMMYDIFRGVLAQTRSQMSDPICIKRKCALVHLACDIPTNHESLNDCRPHLSVKNAQL